MNSKCPTTSEQQVSYYKRISKSGCSSLHADELYSVMQKCKEEAGSHHFIRDIRAAPEPLATDIQLLDMVKFGTREEEFCIVTIDPTFDVTPVTYRHLLLESNRSQKPPVHYRKTFQTYLNFASTLIGLQPELVNICAFGRDGEVL